MNKAVSPGIFLCLLIAALFCFSASARAGGETTVETFADGSRIETTMEIGYTFYDPDDPNPGTDEWYHESTDRDIKRTLTRIYYDADNHADWKAVLSATFRVGVLRARCINYETKFKIYDDAWRRPETNVVFEANTCAATFTFRCFAGGVAVKTVETTLQMTCDRKGNVTTDAPKESLSLTALRQWLRALRNRLQLLFRFF